MLEINVVPDKSWSGKEQREACEDLFSELQANLVQGKVEPKVTEGVADKRSVVGAVSAFVATGIEMGAFGALFEIIKTWLSSRPKCEVTLTDGQGNIIKVSNLTVEQAIKLREQHVAQTRAKTS